MNHKNSEQKLELNSLNSEKHEWLLEIATNNASKETSEQMKNKLLTSISLTKHL